MLIVALLVVALLLTFQVVNMTIVFALGARLIQGSVRFWRTVLFSLLTSILVHGVGIYIYMGQVSERLEMAQYDATERMTTSWINGTAWLMGSQILLGAFAVTFGLYRSVAAYKARINRKRNLLVITVLGMHALAILLLMLVVIGTSS
ncbi:MAG: hypothetical protein KF797_03695 [Flavobacteriales bacterium]|nr:hypothetical protein [Flavobacteriales bacterium]